MKKIIFLITVFSVITLLQGCYTVLDIPENDSTEYEYVAYEENVPVIIYEPIPVPPPSTYYPPTYETYQPEVTTPQTKERTNGSGNGNSTIRNDGNGRGNTGRDTDFTSNNVTRTESYSSSNNNSSSNSNNNTRNSSGTRNSGNGRR
jgi:hypothetical protein